MHKSDKELTAEIVCACLQAYAVEGRIPPKIDDLPMLIETVYAAIRKLDCD